MARFILDVANCDKNKIKKIFDLMEDSFLGGELARLTVIDETNDGQFNEIETDDKLTEKQIQNYNETLNQISK
jgi:hypothetical protein